MPGSPTQKKLSDKKKSSSAAAGQATTASAATTAQPPTAVAAAAGAQDVQVQTAPEAQVGGKRTEEKMRQRGDAAGSSQQSSDALSQIVGMSQTDGEEEDLARREAVLAEPNSKVPWGIRQFWEDESNAPIWARPPHASKAAAKQFYIARAVTVIRGVNTHIPIPQRR